MALYSFLFDSTTMIISNNDFHVLKTISICQRKEYSSWTCFIGTHSHGVFVTYIFSPDNILLFSEYDFLFLFVFLLFFRRSRNCFLLDDTERVAQTKPCDPQHKHFLLHTFHQVISALSSFVN